MLSPLNTIKNIEKNTNSYSDILLTCIIHEIIMIIRNENESKDVYVTIRQNGTTTYTW